MIPLTAKGRETYHHKNSVKRNLMLKIKNTIKSETIAITLKNIEELLITFAI